jgi:hypothetical protein
MHLRTDTGMHLPMRLTQSRTLTADAPSRDFAISRSIAQCPLTQHRPYTQPRPSVQAWSCLTPSGSNAIVAQCRSTERARGPEHVIEQPQDLFCWLRANVRSVPHDHAIHALNSDMTPS